MKIPNTVKGPRVTFFIKRGTETVLVKQVPLLTPDQIAEKERDEGQAPKTKAGSRSRSKPKREGKDAA